MIKFLTVAVITFTSASVFGASLNKKATNKSRGPASVATAPKHFKDPRSFSGSTSYGLPADLLQALKAKQK